MRTILQMMFGKSLRSGPPARIVSPWPDGADTVDIFMWESIGDFKKGGRYVLSREAFSKDDEPGYLAAGMKGSWSEASLKELVIQGKIAVLPNQDKKTSSEQ